MTKMYQAVLTSPEEKKSFIELEKVATGEYKVVGAQGLRSLEGYTLAFDIKTKGVTNLDHTSESFTCFGQSEHLTLNGPALTFKFGTFYVQNLTHLQAGLDRLRGEFTDNGEF